MIIADAVEATIRKIVDDLENAYLHVRRFGLIHALHGQCTNTDKCGTYCV